MPVPFNALSLAMRGDFLASVVRRSLDHGDAAPPPLRSRLRAALGKIRGLDGFRSGRSMLSVPVLVLAPHVTKLCHQNGILMSAILAVWIDSQPRLRTICEEFLSAKGKDVFEFSDLKGGFANTWSSPEALAQAEELAASIPSPEAFDQNDVVLMLCCLTGSALVPPGNVSPTPSMLEEDEFTEASELIETMREETPVALTQNDTSERAGDQPRNEDSLPASPPEYAPPSRIDADRQWHAWLKPWLALEPESAEWDLLPGFLRNLEALGLEKRGQREVGRMALRTALQSLYAAHAEDLDFFEADTDAWSAEACSRTEAVAWAAAVEQLAGLLTQYRHFADAPPKTITEKRRLQQGLETEIIALCVRITAALSDSTGATPHGSQGGDPEPESPPVSGDIHDTFMSSSDPAPPYLTEGRSEADALLEKPTLPALQLGVEGELALHPSPAVNADDTPALGASSAPDLPGHSVEGDTDEPGRGKSAIEEKSCESPSVPDVAEILIDPCKETQAPLTESAPAGAAVDALDEPAPDTVWFWSLVRSGDLAGAYWAVRSETAAGGPAPCPDWLLAASCAAALVEPGSDEFSGDLRRIASAHTPEGRPAEAMLGLSASLAPVLLAPGAGAMVAWLQTPDFCPQLQSVIAAVREFAGRGHILNPALLHGATSEASRGIAFTEVSQKAQGWLDVVRQSRPSYPRPVWDELRRARLEPVFRAVIADDRAQLEAVRAFAGQFERREDVNNNIQEINRQQHGKRAEEIVGSDRDKMVRDLLEGARTARTWCQLVGTEQRLHAHSDWEADQAAQLRRKLEAAWPEAQTAVLCLAENESAVAVAAAAHCLGRVLGHLHAVLNLSTPLLPAFKAPIEANPIPRPAGGIEAALGQRLLWLPEILRAADGKPAESELPRIAAALRGAEGRTITDATELWLRQRDFRFIDEALSVRAAGAEEDSQAADDRRIRDARQQAERELRDAIRATENAVNRSLADGAVTEEDYATYTARIVEMQAGEVVNFAPCFAALGRIQEDLREARHQRVEHLSGVWEALQDEGFSNAAPEQWTQARQRIQQALDAEDTRLVDEYLSLLREAQDKKEELPEALVGTNTGHAARRRELERYLETLPRILEWLERRSDPRSAVSAVRAGQTLAEIAFGQLPQKRRDEAAGALERWRQLKPGPPARDGDGALKELLQFLGFTDSDSPGRAVAITGQGTDWLRARAQFSAGILSRPIPQFGSQAMGRYDVVCLWDRPGADTIISRLKDLNLSSTNPLVLYLGRLKLQQRLELLNATRDENIFPAILDETLLLFLAGERDTRLPAFLRCALPFTALRPYMPDKAGEVPEEMFFGRRNEIAALQDPNGPCLVYGGRQLGKSALLTHVQRQFHAPAQGRYAFVEDIKRVGDPPLADQTTERLWLRLRDECVRWNLIQNTTASTAETIIRQIRDALDKDPDRRVLAMFDEADNFLDADARTNFSVVDNLRKLMNDTGRRFKVVFAGLHQVQRFTNISNQPLAHFGDPIRVGPLDLPEAVRLVRRPLETLGFRLEETTDLRILSYTNYHPGLVQKFCHALLDRLNSRLRSIVPAPVTQVDVEAVYHDPAVRAFIRDRFELTLALDARYQAIAWTLVQEQTAYRDSFARAYDAPEILGMVAYWWPAEFDAVRSDYLRILLEEMCGLGVLVRTEGQYRLRSPNLVRLMGTETEISHRLLELSDRPRQKPPDAESLRAPLDEKAHRYSPFTYSQERALNPARSGVGLVFASPALGGGSIQAALERLVPSEAVPPAGFALIPAGITGEAEMHRWLQTYVSENRAYERIFTCQFVATAHGSLEARIRGALRFCEEREKKPKGQRTRVAFVLSPEATWAWLSLPRVARDEMERLADAAIAPHCWDVAGVRQRAEQHELLGTERVGRDVLDATGGWPLLLDQVFDRCNRGGDPREAAGLLQKHLQEPRNTVRTQFLEALGVQGQAPVWQILNLVNTLGKCDRETLVEMAEEASVSRAQGPVAVEFLLRLGCLRRDLDEAGQENVDVDPIVRQLLATP
jgi:hypothetical protein